MAAVLLVLLGLAFGVAAVLALALWASPFGAALLGILVVGVAVWLGAVRASDRSLSDAVRRTGGRRVELLGPGGPDDPDRRPRS